MMNQDAIKKEFESQPQRIVRAGENHTNNNDEIIFDYTKLSSSKFKELLIYKSEISIASNEYILTALLCCLSGAIGKNPHFHISNSMNIHLNIWSIIIGPSSIMRKSTAMNLVKEELQRKEGQAYKEYKKEFSEYTINQQVAKSQKKQLQAAVPKRKYFLFPNDVTVESLSDILSYSTRGLMAHSEFGSLLAQLNKGYAGDAKQFLTTVFDVPESYEISRVTKGNIVLEKPFISILGASTIDWIKENSSASDLRTGFLARFLFSIRNKPDKPFIPILNLHLLTKQSDHYISESEIYRNLTAIDEPYQLSVTESASKYFNEFDEKNYYSMLTHIQSPEVSFEARLIIYALKFAGIIALTDGRSEVNLQDIQDGILISDYYKRNVEKLLRSEMNKTEFNHREEKILNCIKEYGTDGIIQRSKLLNNSNFTADELNQVVFNLNEKEIISIREEKVKGKTKQYYCLTDINQVGCVK